MADAPTLVHYNVTSILNASDGQNLFVKLVRFVSDPDPTTSSKFDFMPGILVIITIGMIIFFSMKARGFASNVCFFSSSLVIFMVSLLFYPLKVLSGAVLVWTLVLFLASLAWLWLSS